MIKAKCSECGIHYPVNETHICADEKKARAKVLKAAKEAKTFTEAVGNPADVGRALDEFTADKVKGPNAPVMVRMPPDLLSRVDLNRGGMTRPQFIRKVLDDSLNPYIRR